MGGFFTPWALWEKMTFVLACALVVTIGLGCFKLWYNHWRIRRYVADAARRVPQTQETRDAELADKRRNEIPFGIRALERGVQVDGIWISRSNLNTPVRGSPASSITSSTWNYSSPSKQLRLSLPEVRRPELSTSDPNNGNSTRKSRSSFDRAVDAQQLSSRDVSCDSLTSNVARSHGDETLQRDWSTRRLLRNSATLSQLEGHNRRDSREYSSPHPRYSVTLDSTGRGITAEPTGPVPQPQLEDHRTNLDLLQSHRLSHVAETGQLTPRVRRNRPSMDWAHPRTSSKPLTAPNYYIPRRRTPTSDDNANPFSTPVSYVSLSQLSSDSHPRNTAKQAQPLLDEGQDLTDVQINSLTPIEAIKQRRQSQVIRKVNSGFEILRPGSLDVATTHESNDLEKGQRRHSRRLQKKRNVSQSRSSRSSSFSEQL